jgi:hypothetical protein
MNILEGFYGFEKMTKEKCEEVFEKNKYEYEDNGPPKNGKFNINEYAHKTFFDFLECC